MNCFSTYSRPALEQAAEKAVLVLRCDTVTKELYGYCSLVADVDATMKNVAALYGRDFFTRTDREHALPIVEDRLRSVTQR